MAYFKMEMDTFMEFLMDHERIDPWKVRTVFDIGAMDGKDAVWLSRLFPRSTVHAIEGLTANYEKSLKKLRSIKAHNIVVADHDGTVTFYEKTKNGIHSMYERIVVPTKEKREVPCVRMDTFLRTNKLPVPEIVKLDVEGGAYDVLTGFGETLRNVIAIQIETETKEWFQGQKLQKDVYELLEKAGFRCALEQECCEGQCDSIFINDAKKSKILATSPLFFAFRKHGHYATKTTLKYLYRMYRSALHPIRVKLYHLRQAIGLSF